MQAITSKPATKAIMLDIIVQLQPDTITSLGIGVELWGELYCEPTLTALFGGEVPKGVSLMLDTGYGEAGNGYKLTVIG